MTELPPVNLYEGMFPSYVSSSCKSTPSPSISVAAERAAYEEKKRRANRKAEEEAARVAARRTKEDALRRSEAEEYSDEPDDLELPDAAPKSTFIDKLRRRIAKLVDDVDGKDDNSTDL